MDSDRNDTTDGPRHDEALTNDRTDHHDRVVVADAPRSAQDHRSDDAHLTDAEVARLRTLLNDGSLDDGASRFKWFLLGFVAALVALVVAAGAFLVVSDDDDDGRLDLDVPEVDVNG